MSTGEKIAEVLNRYRVAHFKPLLRLTARRFMLLIEPPLLQSRVTDSNRPAKSCFMMEKKLQKAIGNNRALYASIFAANGLELNVTETHYSLVEESPPLYSNLVTCSPDQHFGEVIQTIDDIYENEQWSEWSIKDSFNNLDLRDRGFSKLFEANWLYLQKDSFHPSPEALPIDIRCISQPEEIKLWIDLWGEGLDLGHKIFSPKVLSDPSIKMLIYTSDSISGVALLNQEDGQPVGISNFFPQKETTAIWSSLLAYIFENLETDEVVGYEDSETLAKIKGLGIEPIGPLSVWLKKRAT